MWSSRLVPEAIESHRALLRREETGASEAKRRLPAHRPAYRKLRVGACDKQGGVPEVAVHWNSPTGVKPVRKTVKRMENINILRSDI